VTTGTILLVEDHEDNRNIYRTILEHFGFRVLLAGDGQEGIRQAGEGRPDLILLDIDIPVFDGLEVARQLKASSATCRIPIVALTAYSQPEDRERAAEAGFDGYLAKPVSPRRVLSEVRRFLSAAAEPVVVA
jgi:two-component system, cell cycle response regulator DivK